MTNNLSLIFQPRGVAVIGASRDPHKLGHGVLRNLVQHGYSGHIVPINRRVPDILGLKAYPSVADAPDPIDLAVLIVPAPYVASALEECGQRGIPTAIIASGGFREVGAEGLEREEAVKAVAKQYGIHLVGPNCIGTIDTHTPLNTTFVKGMPRPGGISFVSQSGAMAAAVIDWSVGSGVGFSRIVSLGNQAGVTEYELIDSCANDGITQVISVYMEGVSNGHAFLETATRITPEIPIIALKVGRGEGAAKAVASHTGALAGDESAYDSAFSRGGVLRAKSLEEMLDWSRALAWQALPMGNRVAILTNAGGPGVLALDSLEDAGMDLAPLTQETKDYLRQRVFDSASVQNPVDILAGSGPATYAVCLDALLADPTVDAVVVLQAPQDWFEPVSLAEVVGEVANSPLARKKPILTSIMGLASTSEATEILHRKRVPNFAFPGRIGSTLGAMWRRRQWLDSYQSGDADIVIYDDFFEKQIADALTQADADGWLSLDGVDSLLGACHIPTPGSGIARSAEEAVTLAESIGYPVVMKLSAEGVLHKTDVGGVALNLTDESDVRLAYIEMMEQADSVADQIDGVLIQAMISTGRELIIGMVRDPQFGPLDDGRYRRNSGGAFA